MEKLLIEKIAYMWLSGMQISSPCLGLESNVKVNVEFGLVAVAHKLRKSIERMRSNAVATCL